MNKKKAQSNVHLIQLESYKAPTTVESNREDWVQFGEDNNFFKYLIDRFNNSTTNNSVINNISKLIYGRGIDATSIIQQRTIRLLITFLN